jgi:hypothetical protein
MGTTREIVAKAMKDEAFRTKLLKDPKGAIQNEFGVQFPPNVKVQVHQNSSTVINLVLPAVPEMSNDRALSDEELAQVAGGALSLGGDTFGGFTSCCTRVKKPLR